MNPNSYRNHKNVINGHVIGHPCRSAFYSQISTIQDYSNGCMLLSLFQRPAIQCCILARHTLALFVSGFVIPEFGVIIAAISGASI